MSIPRCHAYDANGSGSAHRGHTLRQAPDCLIAAAVVGIGAALATANTRDFLMGDRSVEHRPAGT